MSKKREMVGDDGGGYELSLKASADQEKDPQSLSTPSCVSARWDFILNFHVHSLACNTSKMHLLRAEEVCGSRAKPSL